MQKSGQKKLSDEGVKFGYRGGCGIIRGGSVAEWLKAHDSKSCMQKCIGGSNPLASAIFCRFKLVKIKATFFLTISRVAIISKTRLRKL